MILNTSSEKTPDIELSSFVTYRLSRVQNQLNAQTIQLLRSHSDLALIEWRILRLLDERGQRTLTQLAEELQMDKGQLSRKTSAMRDKGLLESETDDEDHRRQHMRPTKKAAALVDRIKPILERRHKRLVKDVNPDDLRVFFRVLEQLARATKDPVA